MTTKCCGNCKYWTDFDDGRNKGDCAVDNTPHDPELQDVRDYDDVCEDHEYKYPEDAEAESEREDNNVE